MISLETQNIIVNKLKCLDIISKYYKYNMELEQLNNFKLLRLNEIN